MDDLVSLSEQQLEVIKLARPPTPISNNINEDQQPGYMVRVTAAAGTGKTTTLLHLAVRCLDLGHDNVTYVTYSRASATDAKTRILQTMHTHRVGEGDGETTVNGERITASTLHSCAMKLVARETDSDNLEKGLTDDNGLKNLIRDQYKKEIEEYRE